MYNKYIKGIILLLLLIFGNYLSNTVSCGTQRLVTHNMYVKHIIILASIYFSLDYAETKVINPTEHLKSTMIIWIALLMISKMGAVFTIVIYLSLVLYYVLYTYREYYIQTGQDIYSIDSILKYIQMFMFGTIILGFSAYLMKQRHDYKQNFSFNKFIFGTETCSKGV